MLPTPKAERLSVAFNRLAFLAEGHRLLQSPQALPNWDSFPFEVPQDPAWNDHAALWQGGLPHPEQQFAVIPGLGDPLPDPAAPLAQLEAALDETAEIAEARGKRKWMGRPAAKQRRRLACVTEDAVEAPARHVRTPYTRQLSNLPAVQARKMSLFDNQVQERDVWEEVVAMEGKKPGGGSQCSVAKAQERVLPPIKMTKGTFRLSGGVLRQVSD